ncbi:carbohydrate sulfotransferase 10-like [Clavelina lepadiformis]|uniref:Carbohydrate sulfotransferase n=1 Tax=Clavelina lepadiformis TaxID=159417 RepID=A0ABP0EYN0_CLALP
MTVKKVRLSFMFLLVTIIPAYVYIGKIYFRHNHDNVKIHSILKEALQALTYTSTRATSNDVTNEVQVPVTVTGKSTKSVQLHPVEERFKDRLDEAKHVCLQRGVNYNEKWKAVIENGPPTGGFVASESHHAMMCLVLKAGSSTWNDFFWRLRAPEEAEKYNFWERAVHGNAYAFKSLSRDKKIEILQDPNGLRLVGVRHPFARIISGWSDKFDKMYFYNIWFKTFPKLLNYPNKWGRWRGPREGHFMEWVDFASYLADHGHNLTNIDAHFYPATVHCDPCKFPFNFITKLETFATDASWLVEAKLNLSTAMLKPQNVNSKRRKDYVELIKEYFSKLDRNVTKRIYSLYENDMKTFGYSFNLTTLKAGGWVE